MDPTCHYLADHISKAADRTEDSNEVMFTKVADIIKDRNLGLSRTESNLLLIKLATNQSDADDVSLKNMATFDNIRSLLFRAHKLSVLRSLSHKLVKEELTPVLAGKLHFESVRIKTVSHYELLY
jgi:hypothetical protein